MTASYSDKHTQRKRAHAFYDVTTIAFENTKLRELRLFGFSKDHKSQEVQVVMGLLIDNQGLPISYELFPGNPMDQNILVDSVQSLRELYRLDEITVVADRGLNGKNNLVYLQEEGYHFVISYTLKRSPQDMKALVFADANSWNTVEIPVKVYLTWSRKRTLKDDGYYAIMTDRIELSTSEVVSIYKGLWKIEESFRILKTDLQARPVFVWSDDHVKGHFALCFLSLYMIRLLQHRLEQEGY